MAGCSLPRTMDRTKRTNLQNYRRTRDSGREKKEKIRTLLEFDLIGVERYERERERERESGGALRHRPPFLQSIIIKWEKYVKQTTSILR